MDEFVSKVGYLSAFVVSAYVLGFVSGPLLFTPLSEVLGHAPVYLVCNLLYTGGMCGCAMSKNLVMLAGMRILAGCGGGATQVLACSSIRCILADGDVRKIVLMVVQLALYVPLVVAPLAGKYISEMGLAMDILDSCHDRSILHWYLASSPVAMGYN